MENAVPLTAGIRSVDDTYIDASPYESLTCRRLSLRISAGTPSSTPAEASASPASPQDTRSPISIPAPRHRPTTGSKISHDSRRSPYPDKEPLPGAVPDSERFLRPRTLPVAERAFSPEASLAARPFSNPAKLSDPKLSPRSRLPPVPDMPLAPGLSPGSRLPPCPGISPAPQAARIFAKSDSTATTSSILRSPSSTFS